MYNSGRRGKRAPDGYGVISVNDKFNQTSYPIPIIDSWSITDGSYNPIDDTALDPAGGQTIVLYGSGFASGATVNINGSNIGIVTVLDSNRITFTSPALSAASYTIYVSNTDGATAIYVPGLVYSGLPTWSSPPSDTIGASYETKDVSTLNYTTFTATGDATITYSIISGNLPDGVTLSSSGELSGTLPATASPTTYSFTIRASDEQNQDSDRAFSLTINPDAVTWVAPTLNGSLSVYETQSFSTPLSATSAAGYGVMYSADTLPTGITLNPSTGELDGYANTVGNTNAQLTATANTTGRYTTSNVTFTVNQDVVTWSSPADNTAYTLGQNDAMSAVTLLASSAVGYGVQYTANALPTGVTLSGDTISGTPTESEIVYTELTATSNTTNRTATRFISWTVNVAGDQYFIYNSMLFSANNLIQTPSFVSDNSINNAQLTVFGDTRATNFNPYQVGYYSNFFDGTSDYLTTDASTNFDMGTGDFTIECFALTNGYAGSGYGRGLFALYPSGNYNKRIIVRHTNADNRLNIYGYDGSSTYFGSSGTSGTQALTTGTWNHIAFVRQSGVFRLYINGIQDIVVSNQTSVTLATSNCFDIGRVQEGTVPEWNGNISNFRVIKGTCLYNNGTTFTPPTTPFLPSSTIQLLTCQSNRLIDSSITNITLTKGGDTKVSSAHPFSTVYQAGTQYYSTKLNGDYLTVPAGTAFSYGTGDFTIEAWVYITELGDGFVWAQTTAYDNWVYLMAGTNGPSSMGVDPNVPLSLNTWYHLAVSRISGTVRLFSNGTQIGSTTNNTDYTNTSYVPTIGRYSHHSSYYFPGYVSNLRVIKGQGLYSGNFTPSTIPLTATSVGSTGAGAASTITGFVSLLTCQDSTFKDNSLNNFIVTQNFGVAKPLPVSPFTPSSYTNTEITTYGSGYFDGSGDYITIPATPSTVLTGDFTVEVWIYPTVLNTNNMVFGSDNGTNSDYFNITSSSINFAISAPTSPNYPSWNYTFTVNQWYHVVLVRQSNTLSAFVNGIKLALSSGSASESRQFFQSSVALLIGRYGYATNPWYFTGYISGARIVKGTALYTSDFVPQFTSPLSNVTNTQLLTLQTNGSHNNSIFKDQSSFNNVITRNGNVTNGTFSPYGDNWSTYFNGSAANQYFTLPTATATLLGGFNGNYTTIEFFVNQTQTSTSATENEIFGTFAAAAANGRFIITLGSASATNQPSKVRFMWTTSTGTTDTIIATNTIPVNTWSHVAIVVNATGSAGSHTVTIYTNGVGETFTGKNFSSQTSTYDRLRVGGNSESYLYGYLSNLRVTRATTNTVGYSGSSISVPTGPLSALPSTKLLLCQSNRFIDSSINTNTVSVLGTPTIQKFSPFSTVTVPKYYSTYFDGNGDWLTFTNTSGQGVNFGTGDFTVELWYYMTDNTTNSTYHTFIRQDTATNAFDFGYRPGAGNLTVAAGNVGEVTASVTLAKNTWYHLAASRSGTSLRFFVNGTQVGTTATNSYNFNVTGGTVRIGGNSFNAAYTPYGYISNLRCTKEALYTTNFTPSIAPLVTGANTTLLTCQNNLIVDNSVNRYTLSVNGDVKPLPFSPFTPTASSVTSYSPTVFGGSMYFDGTGDYLQTATGLIHTDITQTDYTVEFWVYNMGPGAERYIFSQRGASSGWEVRINADNTLSTFFTGGTTITTTGYTIKGNEWTHVAICRASGVTKVFFNGVVTNSTGTVQSNGTSAYASYGLWLGNGTTGGGLMLGYISDARVIKGRALYSSNFYPGPTPLTPTAETTYLLNGTSGGVIDATRTVDLETVADAKVTNFSPYNGSYYSNYFDGNDTRLTVPAGTAFNMGSGDFSIEMWVNPISNSTYGALLTFDAADHPICIYYGSGVNSGNIMAAAGTTSAWFTNTSAMTFGTTVPGKWSHILLTRSGDSWRCFQDGVLRYYATQAGTVGDSSGNIYIGANGSSIYRVTAYISNLRIIKGSVPTGYQTSSTTVGATIFTPSTSPLTTTSQGATSANVSLLTCQDNKFIDNSTNNFTITNVNNGIKINTRNPFQVNTGQSYYFDGTGDWLTTPYNPSIDEGTGQFTWEAWVYPTSLAHTSKIIDGAGTNEGFMHIETSGALTVGRRAIANDVSGGTVRINQWTHVAASRDSSNTLRIYVNGAVVGTSTPNTNNYGPGGATRYIGSDVTGTSTFTGYIADLRITKGVARYTSSFTPPTSPLILK